MVDVITDVEWSLRAWLRGELPDIKVWFSVPKGNPTFPMIVVEGRIGGGPEESIPLDYPRMSFSVWGGPASADGRATAMDAASELVNVLHGIAGESLDAETYAFSAYDITMLWVPDVSDPDNMIARYVVDASFLVRSQ